MRWGGSVWTIGPNQPASLRRRWWPQAPSQDGEHPRGGHGADWDERDFIGWHDPRALERAYLVARLAGRPIGVLLRKPAIGTGRGTAALCELWRSVHDADGVLLFVAPQAGAAGGQGNSVGTYICADLVCSLYAFLDRVAS